MFAQQQDDCLEMKEGYLCTYSKTSHHISKTESYYITDIVFYEKLPNTLSKPDLDSVLNNGKMIQISKYNSKYLSAPKNDVHKQYLKSSIIKNVTLDDSTQVTIRKVFLIYKTKTEKAQDYVNDRKGYNRCSFFDCRKQDCSRELTVLYPELILSAK